MSTALTVRTNYVNPDNTYVTNPTNYLTMDLINDYLIWTAGDTVVKDLMTHEPTPEELNAAASIIDTDDDVMAALCLLMDYSHDVGGAYYTHKVLGMGENKRYVFCFDFDGATATEPQLEAWDNSGHSSYLNHVLGNNTPLNSMVKAICTTIAAPGASWVGTPIAGGSNVILLNAGAGALGVAGQLYANIKIVIPADYSTPAAETFVLTVRYTWS
jgi:hypothetical protein